MEGQGRHGQSAVEGIGQGDATKAQHAQDDNGGVAGVTYVPEHPLPW